MTKTPRSVSPSLYAAFYPNCTNKIMADRFTELSSFLGHNLIQGIFISVFLVVLVKILFKGKIEVYISAQIIRWIIIAYAFVAILSTLSLMIFEHSEEYAFLKRASGPYWWAYLLMLVSNSVVPLILINNKLGEKLLVLFIIALLMNLGWLFESFVIHVTSMHRDYITESYNSYLPNAREVRILLNGFFIGLFSLIIGNGIKKWNVRLE